MANAAGVRAGQCFVEIHANDTHFQRGMVILSNRMQAIGQRLRTFGANLGIGAAAVGAPIIGAIRATASFEDALLELRAASSDITPEQFRAVHDESLRLSRVMGVGPERIAQSFAQLIKAGMGVQDALDGAARSAVEFAHVSGVDAEAAAIFMKVAMNVFGVSAREAVDTLSAAADASETSIASMVQGFSLVSSAGVTFNQTLFGISQAMALLARYGIQGEEAGTGLKVLLSRLVAPSGEAEKALAQYNLTVADFRDQTQKLLPMAQIVDILASKMKDVGEILNNQMLVKVFGDRGIKVIGAFAHMGRKGFDELARSMQNNRSVSAKFEIMMGGLTGFMIKANTAAKLLSIGFSEGLSSSLNAAGDSLIYLASAIADFLRAHPILARLITYGTAAAAAMAALSYAAGWLATGVSAFLAAGVHLTRWMAGVAAFAPLVVNAVTAIGGALAALAASGPLGVLALVVSALTGLYIGGTMLANWLSGSPSAPPAAPQAPAGGDGRARVTVPHDLEPMQGGLSGQRGANVGTFMAAIAQQIGVGPQLDAATRTADATEMTAEGVGEMAAMMRANVPGAGDLQAGMAAAGAAVGGSVQQGGRDIVSAAEKTALESARTNELLRRLVDAADRGGLVFA